jgi:hypothetical protein
MITKVLPPRCCVMLALCLALPAWGQGDAKLPKLQLKSYHPAPRGMSREMLSRAAAQVQADSAAQSAPVDPIQFAHWTFQVKSSRDGNSYPGVMVGNRALDGGFKASNVPVEIVPVIVKTVALGTAVDLITGAITIATGSPADDTTFNPTKADDSCLAPPNNVPSAVFRQSPLFQTADFNFGGTDVGNTQATDAYQRASFWNTIDRSTYHVLLAPVRTLGAVTLHAQAPSGGVGGIALDLPNLIPGICGRIGLVDIGTIDSFVTSQFNTLLGQGVRPSNFPIFMFYNTAFSIGDPTNLANCCAGGYHNAVNVGTNANPIAQTYSSLDFDMTGFFINNSGSPVSDVEIASHEVAEWMDDPLGFNPVPAWGNSGQVQGSCQTNLEVGDPLSGNEAPRIFMPNGFTYHLQELAFFSWFFGEINGARSSLGVHRWFSDNATFLTDAGPVCIPPPI